MTAPTDWEGPGPARRGLVAVVGLFLLAGGGLVARSGTGSSAPEGGTIDVKAGDATQSEEPTPSATTEPSPAPATVARGGDGGQWTDVPGIPVQARLDVDVVWTGRHVVVWGGQSGGWPARSQAHSDGVGLDPGSGEWTLIGGFPLPPRAGSAVAWTGGGLLVWGGSDAAAHRNDGALLRDGVWQVMAPSPLSPRTRPHALAMGDRVLVFGGYDNRGPLADGAVYDVAARSWQLVGSVPSDIAGDVAAAMTDLGPVAWQQQRTGPDPDAIWAARFDARSNRWQQLPPVPDGSAEAAGLAGVTAVGGTLYAAASSGAPELFRLDPGAATWEPLDARDYRYTHPWTSRLLSSDRSVFMVSADGQLSGYRYDTATDRWAALPPHQGTWLEMDAVWTGTELFVVGTSLPEPPEPAVGELLVRRWRR
jgi:hypothetical protein